jgi:hypothetical protein
MSYDAIVARFPAPDAARQVYAHDWPRDPALG